MAGHAGAGSRPHDCQGSCVDGTSERGTRAHPHARRGQDAERFTRRGAKIRQHPRIHGRGIAPPGGRNATERASEELCLHAEAAAGCGGGDHALEFPGRHTRVESGAGAGGGQHRGAEACGAYASDGGARGENLQRSGTARGCTQYGARHRGRGRRRVSAASRGARRIIYWLEYHRHPRFMRPAR